MNISEIREVGRLKGVWNGIRSRCEQSSDKQYKDYGGRGIYLCEEWQDFATFALWSLINGSAEGLHIDRTDNDGPYAPWNCAYVTPQVNNLNRRSTVWVTAFGERKTVSQWAEDPRCVVPRETLGRRVQRFGWDPEEAVTLRSRKDRTDRVCADEHLMSDDNVYVRANGSKICKKCAKKRAKENYKKR